jgi:creatinine amidohydrolase/Fe(II)-dependent formamide hydrolase-like protein
MEAASAGMVDDSFYEPSNRETARRELFIHGTQAFSDIGVLGDPTGASREAGAELLAVAARSLARDLQEAPVTANLP